MAAAAVTDASLSWLVCRRHPKLGVFEIWLSGSTLSPPTTVPERYVVRSTINEDKREAYVKHSAVTDFCPLRTRKDLRTHGIWVCEADFEPHGGHPSHPGCSCVTISGMRVASGIMERFREALGRMEEALPPMGPVGKVLAVGYHGTSTSNLSSICRTTLRASNGMMGRGVYLAHFWKAALRYGALDARYGIRPEGGAVFRAYIVSWNDDEHIREIGTPESPMCPCDVPCQYYRSVGRAAWSRACDHQSLWRNDARVVGVHVDPETCDTDNGGARVINNEEWCVREEHVVLQSAHYVDMTCVHRPKEPGILYDAFDRDVTIA